MGVFRYESIYLGLPTFYHAVGQDGANTDGFQAVQLVSTRDLRTWNRVGNRSWFLSPSKAGSGAYDQLELLGPSNAIVANDTLLLYYTGLKVRAPAEAPDWLRPPEHAMRDLLGEAAECFGEAFVRYANLSAAEEFYEGAW